MDVRDHLADHERIDELPLLTESAVVTDISAMDRNRTDEVLAELRATLEEYGTDAWYRTRPESVDDCEEWLRSRLDAADHREGETPFQQYLPGYAREGVLGEQLAALQGRYLRPHPSLFSVTVEPDEPVEFVAGQYLGVRYQETTRVYSIASAPGRETLEFCIQRVPGGELTSELAVDLEVGDSVALRGPYGDLHLEEPSERDVVFLATGTGVAPFKSMIDDLFERGLDRYEGEQRDVWLFLGAGWADTLPYHETFQAYADERANFHYVPTVSRESSLSEWEGETAYVQYVLAKYLDGDVQVEGLLTEAVEQYRDETPRRPVDATLTPSRMEVYACGLTAMVESLVAAAERMGVPPEHTQFEGFG